MSYNGTVRCGYCYTRGHNRRSCEAYTKKLKDLAENSESNYLKDHYNQEYIKRTGKNADGSEPAAGLKPKKSRRQCGWCKKSGFSYEETSYGHNKQTCPNRKEWIVAKAEETGRLRATMRSRARALGVGIGTMIETTNSFYDKSGVFGSHRVVGIIEKIDWDTIDITRLDEACMVVYWINSPRDDYRFDNGVGRRANIRIARALIPSEIVDREYRAGERVEIVSKSSNPLAGCPSDWEHQVPNLREDS